MRGAWRRALAWERGDSCTDPANLLGIHLPCTPLATCDLLGFADALCSALTAGDFFLGRQEKVTKKKATPALRGRLRRLPCATRQAGRLRNSGLCPSDSPRRLPPAPLRCSALHEGEGKAHRTEFDAPYGRYSIGSQFALCVVEQRKTRRGKGRGLSEDRRSEFRSPPLRLSSAETPA